MKTNILELTVYVCRLMLHLNEKNYTKGQCHLRFYRKCPRKLKKCPGLCDANYINVQTLTAEVMVNERKQI